MHFIVFFSLSYKVIFGFGHTKRNVLLLMLMLMIVFRVCIPSPKRTIFGRTLPFSVFSRCYCCLGVVFNFLHIRFGRSLRVEFEYIAFQRIFSFSFCFSLFICFQHSFVHFCSIASKLIWIRRHWTVWEIYSNIIIIPVMYSQRCVTISIVSKFFFFSCLFSS